MFQIGKAQGEAKISSCGHDRKVNETDLLFLVIWSEGGRDGDDIGAGSGSMIKAVQRNTPLHPLQPSPLTPSLSLSLPLRVHEAGSINIS